MPFEEAREFLEGESACLRETVEALRDAHHGLVADPVDLVLELLLDVVGCLSTRQPYELVALEGTAEVEIANICSAEVGAF